MCEDREESSTLRGRCLDFLSQEEKADGKRRLRAVGLHSRGPMQAEEQRSTAVSERHPPSASSVGLGSPRLESGKHHNITQGQAHHQDASLSLRPACAPDSQKCTHKGMRWRQRDRGQQTVHAGYMAT